MITKKCSFCDGTFDEEVRTKSKYCGRKCYDNARKRQRAFNIPRRMGELVGAAKHRSKAKGVPFNIDKDHLLKLWEEQEGHCCITKQPFELSYETSLQRGWSKRNSPSLDRIVPEAGYVKGNVRLVTYQVNMAKGAFRDEDFYDMCRKALEHIDA